MFDNEVCVAVYYVQWTRQQVLRHGAMFDLLFGDWSENGDAGERFAVAVECRFLEAGPALMIVDATDRPPMRHAMVSEGLLRDDVIGTPCAKIVFDITDVIWLGEPRMGEFRI